jgi:hypothetical protein
LSEHISATPLSPSPSISRGEWHFIHDGQQVGPISPPELIEKAAFGEIEADDLVRQTDGPWSKARDVLYLQGAFTQRHTPEAVVPERDIRRPIAINFTAIGVAVLVVLVVAACIAGVIESFSGDITDTTWSGSETLQGFGYLKFEFRPNSVAIMTDATSAVKGTVPGKWTRSGSEVTITFRNCTYRGTINGAVLSGTADSRQLGRWSFSLKKK